MGFERAGADDGHEALVAAEGASGEALAGGIEERDVRSCQLNESHPPGRLMTMNKSIRMSRRAFVQTSATAAVATLALGPAQLALGAEPARRWVVTVRDAHLRATGLDDCWSAAKALGVGGLEINVNEQLQCSALFHPRKKYAVDSGDGLKALQEDLAAQGLVATALCMNNRLDERLEEETAWMKKVAAAAQGLGAKAIRIDVVPHKVAKAEFLPFAIRACRQLCDLVKGSPVRLGIENHSNTSNDPVFLEKLFAGVGSDHLGLTLDAMNFYWFGHPLDQLYRLYQQFAPRVFHTHCKNLRYPEDKRNAARPMGWEYEKYVAPLYDGDLDYRRIADILRQAKYTGDLCLENECLGHFPKAEHLEVLRKEIALLKTLV